MAVGIAVLVVLNCAPVCRTGNFYHDRRIDPLARGFQRLDQRLIQDFKTTRRRRNGLVPISGCERVLTRCARNRNFDPQRVRSRADIGLAIRCQQKHGHLPACIVMQPFGVIGFVTQDNDMSTVGTFFGMTMRSFLAVFRLPR